MNTKYTVISCFAGGGGSSLGYKMAGFRDLMGIEFNKNAIQTLKLNFPTMTVKHCDMKNIKGVEILAELNIKKGELDVLDGSPPCQGFSLSGRKEFSDSRNILYQQFSRLIRELKPKTFVMENVKGMIQGITKVIFHEIFKDLENCGYIVKCKIMNAVNYGVPQKRKRLVFVGTRKDINLKFEYPEHQEKVSPKEMFKNIEKSEIRTASVYVMKDLVHTKKGESLSKHNKKGHNFNLSRMDENKPVETITTKPTLYHYLENRNVTINELKALHSFPQNYKITGTFGQQWKIIGNSVPPLMMKAIALSIKKTILDPHYRKEAGKKQGK